MPHVHMSEKPKEGLETPPAGGKESCVLPGEDAKNPVWIS